MSTELTRRRNGFTVGGGKIPAEELLEPMLSRLKGALSQISDEDFLGV
jgi:hypothetical protein